MAEKWKGWIPQVEQWRGSGLSAAAWCRENGIVYSQFLYWRQRIAQETGQPFIELTEAQDPRESGIEIETRGITLRLARGFDSTELLRCLQVIGGPHADAG